VSVPSTYSTVAVRPPRSTAVATSSRSATGSWNASAYGVPYAGGSQPGWRLAQLASHWAFALWKRSGSGPCHITIVGPVRGHVDLSSVPTRCLQCPPGQQ
jgi:hypothetical protein